MLCLQFLTIYWGPVNCMPVMVRMLANGRTLNLHYHKKCAIQSRLMIGLSTCPPNHCYGGRVSYGIIPTHQSNIPCGKKPE
jgi:hypothetical protein